MPTAVRLGLVKPETRPTFAGNFYVIGIKTGDLEKDRLQRIFDFY